MYRAFSVCSRAKQMTDGDGDSMHQADEGLRQDRTITRTELPYPYTLSTKHAITEESRLSRSS